MKRKKKKYAKPKKPFDKARIQEEAKIKKDFGLKNKREIWKAESRGDASGILWSHRRQIPSISKEKLQRIRLAIYQIS